MYSCTAANRTIIRPPLRRAPLARRSALRIDEHSRVEDALWIEFSFCCPKRGREKPRALAIVPRPMITANSVMMRDRTTRLNQRVAGSILDRLPLLQKSTVAAECVERKIGRGPVRIDMGEAACDLAFQASRLEDRTLRRHLYFVVETFEPIPGDSGLKSVVDETGRRQKLARIGHANKCVAPDSCRAFEMCIAGFCGLRRPAILGAAFERACHPGVRRMVAGFKAEHHDRDAAVGRTGVECLLRVKDAAVRWIEAGLCNGSQRARRTEERMETNRCAGTEFRTWLQSHPGARNHAERSFRADEHAVGARSGTRSRQSTRFQYAARRHDAQAFDEIVYMRVETGEMTARPCRDPAAKG